MADLNVTSGCVFKVFIGKIEIGTGDLGSRDGHQHHLLLIGGLKNKT